MLVFLILEDVNYLMFIIFCILWFLKIDLGKINCYILFLIIKIIVLKICKKYR